MGKSTHWASVFAVIAIISALLGFGGAAGPASSAAIVLCWMSLLVIVLSFVGSMLRER